jgi:hypothetical protein
MLGGPASVRCRDASGGGREVRMDDHLFSWRLLIGSSDIVDTCITTGRSDSTSQTMVHTKYQDIRQKPKINCEVLQAYVLRQFYL